MDIVIVITSLMFFIIGIVVGAKITEKNAVEAGVARFNEITKKFEWKEIP